MNLKSLKQTSLGISKAFQSRNGESESNNLFSDIQHYVINCPSNNANKPDIAIYDKENNKWTVIWGAREGTV